MAKYIIIGICILLIVLALLLFIRNLRNMAKGKCCDGCEGCSQRGSCSAAPNEEENKEK
ncbi:FeoB-associated Cys-rich membrane protein [Hydrogenoanaerobacterium sp.]|uniref:FeoB-associated Cys-rich membrane protein n=1 Tax=Hydrogenoanaerobacterium sp. TaxID=2953763 RepID=UPI002897C3BE|nr:FeoB-associated Cys-rich membrane protein [Hydrogenoanaerobacterium sp.]